MKNKLKIAGSLFVFSIFTVVGFTGCAYDYVNDKVEIKTVTKDDLLSKSSEIFAASEYMDSDVDLEMELNIGTDNISMDVSNKIDLNITGDKDGVTHIKGKTDVQMLGQERELEIDAYTYTDGDSRIQYSNIYETGTEGRWIYTKTGTDTESDKEDPFSGMSVSDVINACIKIKDVFSDFDLEQETVDHNNIDCYVLRGTIKGDKYVEAISSTGQDISDKTKKSLEATGVDTVVYFRTEDQTPYAIEFDPGKAIDDILTEKIGSLNGMDVTAASSKLSVTFNSFDKNGDVNIPDEIIDNAAEGPISFDMQTLLLGM